MIDWLITTKYNILILEWIGLYPKRHTGYGINFYTCYSIFILSLPLADIVTQTIMIYYILDDLNSLAASMFVLPEKCLVIVKTYKFVNNAKQFQQILNETSSKNFQPKSRMQLSVAQKHLEHYEGLFIVFWGTVTSAVILAVIYPLLASTDERKFFTLAWYPYNSKISPFYEITYAYQSISIAILSEINANVDLIISFLNIFICCQFDILCCKLKHLEENEIISCILHHQQLLKFELISKRTRYRNILFSFAKKCNSFWNAIVLSQFCAGSVILGISLFQLTTVSLKKKT